MADLRKTPLNAVHRESGARMVDFGGWDMPVEYSGVIAEHNAVRTAAGLFDVSHMGQFEVEGEGAVAFLQRTTANNVAKLVDGQAQYSALPMPTGCPVDDIIVYRRSERRFLIVVNAANVEKDWKWLLAQNPSGCGLHNLSDEYGLLALQGPKAAAILQGLTPLDVSKVAFYHFAEGRVDGIEAIVARTGYTGEDGFEFFVTPEAAPDLWRRLIDAGRPSGLVPAGLGARDTLRLEARMMLYGNDIDETTSLIEAGLGWIVSLDEAKGDFNGRAMLAGQKAGGAPRKLVGFETVERGIPRHGYRVYLGDEAVGAVTSGTYAPFLQKSIGLCYLPSARATVGTELAVEIRGRRTAARVVPTPFYKRPR
jgi:glycine cleavage system T protein (aminomethyltransferase)